MAPPLHVQPYFGSRQCSLHFIYLGAICHTPVKHGSILGVAKAIQKIFPEVIPAFSLD